MVYHQIIILLQVTHLLIMEAIHLIQTTATIITEIAILHRQTALIHPIRLPTTNSTGFLSPNNSLTVAAILLSKLIHWEHHLLLIKEAFIHLIQEIILLVLILLNIKTWADTLHNIPTMDIHLIKKKKVGQFEVVYYYIITSIL